MANIKKNDSAVRFINFSNLKNNRANLIIFEQSGLSNFAKSCLKILQNKFPDKYKKNDEIVSVETENKLNAALHALLEMMGKHSSLRPNSTAESQDLFFNSIAETMSFPEHFVIMVYEENKRQLELKKTNNKKTIEKNSKRIKGEVFSDESFKEIPRSKKLAYTSFKLTATELRALASLYMTSLSLKHLTKDKQIASNIDLFKLGLSVTRILLKNSQAAVGYAKGGKGRRNQEVYNIIKSIVTQKPKISHSDAFKACKSEMRRMGTHLADETVKKLIKEYKKNPGRN